MKQLWLYGMRAYLRLGLFFYFKKIDVRHTQNIPQNEPVLFLANHQNALLDALLIATKNGRFSYFLTRASVFNSPMISKILKSLQMLPVYRIRDGWGNLTKNNSVFSQTSKLLSEGHAIVVFPEGSHNLKRTVRPLSKGFTRIVFETLEHYPQTIIHVIPVGLNFANATQFADRCLLNFGKPIMISSHSLSHTNADIVELKEAVANQLRELTTHIESENYEATLKQLERLHVDFTQPEIVNRCISSNFKDCKEEKPQKAHVLKTLSKFLLILNLFIPYLVWKKMVLPKIKEIEFTSTFRFAVAITLVPVFIIVVMLILGFMFHPKFAFMYLINVLVLNLLSIKL